MKNLIIIIIVALFGSNAPGLAQTKSEDSVYVKQPKTTVYKDLLYREPVFSQVEIQPQFPGGFDALKIFFNNNIKDVGEKGKVFAMFIVERDGSLNDIQIIRSFSVKATAEAIRVLRLMPKWKPGMQNGHTVRVTYTLPIAFPK